MLNEFRLRDALLTFLPEEGELQTDIPNLRLYRNDSPTDITCQIYEPALAFVVQGQKQAVIGGITYLYGQTQWLLTPLNIPAFSRILEASPTKPYLAAALFLDLQAARQLLAEEGLLEDSLGPSKRAITAGDVTPDLADAMYRLIAVLKTPEHMPIISKLVQQEILYRLLTSKEGAVLRQIVTTGTQGQRVARAAEWLRLHYRQPFAIEDLAKHTKLAASTLHHQFRAFTGMSPLQYQKQLRLFEARRLMVVEGADASSAAYGTGYESLTQFTREYRRQFGQPPLKDAMALRNGTAVQHSR